MRLIDADALMPNADYKGKYDVVTAYDIANAPTIDAVPVKHGHWIFGETMGHSWMKCSECCVSQSGQTLTFTYCPNCGAKMDVSDTNVGETEVEE